MKAMVGVHRDLPAPKYHALPGASASRLRKLWQSSPAHLRVDMRKPIEPSPAMILGTLAHHAVLEPDQPLPHLVTPPETYPAPADSSLVKTKKVAVGDLLDWSWSAKFCKDWRRSMEAAGKLVVSQSTYDSTFGAALSVARHPLAAPLVIDGESEVSLVTWDEVNDIGVRCRLDHVPPGRALVDCKFTHDVTPRGFARNAYEMGYHIQAALYLDVWNTLCGVEAPKDQFVFVACEQTEPWAVNVFTCSPDFIELGRQHAAEMLALFARCLREDHWPAYPEQIHSLSAPRWALKEAA
jgi:hypothetical protein